MPSRLLFLLNLFILIKFVWTLFKQHIPQLNYSAEQLSDTLKQPTALWYYKYCNWELINSPAKWRSAGHFVTVPTTDNSIKLFGWNTEDEKASLRRNDGNEGKNFVGQSILFILKKGEFNFLKYLYWSVAATCPLTTKVRLKIKKEESYRHFQVKWAAPFIGL